MTNWIVGDSIEYMKNLSDKSFDMILADPPYGEMELINSSIKQARRVSRGVSMYFMYAEDLCDLEQRPDQVLFWVKPSSTKNTSRRHSRFVEVLALYDIARVRLNPDTYWSVRSGVFNDTLIEKPMHIFQKPASLLEKLITVHIPHASVLDPFAGCGSVGAVCDKMGITSTSVEIDPMLEHSIPRPKLVN